MPSDIKLLLDEDVHLALAGALRKRGYDALHVREVNHYLQRGRVCGLAQPLPQRRLGALRYPRFSTDPDGSMLRKLLAFLQTHSSATVQGQIFFL
jgi:hypothetical protein